MSFPQAREGISLHCPLAHRELEALRLIARGLTVKEIARQLGVEATTIRSHLQRVRQKLAVNTTTQAAVACIDAGWLDPVTEDPALLRFSDTRVTAAQRVYLGAFDLHLKARNDAPALAEAKRRTNAALVALDKSPRSVPSRNWIDSLLSDMARVGDAEQRLARRRDERHASSASAEKDSC